MSRSALPQNYITDAGTQIADPDTAILSTLTATDGVGGAAAVKITGQLNQYSGAGKTISLDLSQLATVRVWVRLDSAIANINEVYIEFSSETDYSKRFKIALTANLWLVQDEWVELVGHRDDAVDTGGESWDNTMVRYRIRLAPHGGGTPIASVDDLRYDVEGLPRVIISFDDNNENEISEGVTTYDYMVGLEIPGSLYTIHTLLDTTNYMTTAALQTLYDLGWAVASHDSTGNWSDSQTQAYYVSALQTVLDAFDSAGWTRDKKHYGYPAGVVNDNALAAMESLGMLTGRGVTSMYQASPGDDYYHLKNRVIYKTVSLATVKGWVDETIKLGIACQISFHRIILTEDLETDWSIAKFTALMDYIASKTRQIKPITITEWYEGLTNPRYRSLAHARSAS